MTARAVIEAQAHSALARYKQDVADGMWRVTAVNTLVDAFLKIADKYAERAVTAHVREQQVRRELAARPLIQAVRSVSR